MAVVLDDDVGVLLFDGSNNRSQHSGTTDAGHVFQADLLRAAGNQFLCQIDVIFSRVYLAVRDAHRGLGDHACSFGPFDGRDDVARVIQTAEDTRDIRALRMLDLIHQFAYVRGNGVHAQRVQSAVQHVRLDSRLTKRFGERTNRQIRVLTIQQIHLLRRATVSLHAVKATHVNNHRGNLGQLIFARHIFARTLPHVSIHETELYFFLHIVFFVDISILFYIGLQSYNFFSNYANFFKEKNILSVYLHKIWSWIQKKEP